MVNLEPLRQYASSDEANVVPGTTFKKSPEGPQARTQVWTSLGRISSTPEIVELNSARECLVLTPRKHGTKGLQN